MIIKLNVAPSCAQDICKLEKICFSDCWSLEVIKKDIENANSVWLAAYDGDVLVGYACAMAVCDEAEINRIAVKNEYRNRGIGHFMLKELISELVKRCCHKIFLEVRETNKSAISLYKKNGFDSIGIRKNYYCAPTENALIMMHEIN